MRRGLEGAERAGHEGTGPAQTPGRGPHPSLRLSTFQALQYPDYSRLWYSQVLSQLAGWMAQTGQLWLIYELTDSTVALGLTGLLHAIPVASLAMFGGALADRMDRRRIIAATELLAVGLLLGLGLLTVTGLVQAWQIYAIVFFFSIVRAFGNPARRAMVPGVVPRSVLHNAVALDSTLHHSIGVIGPGLGGLLIARVDVSACFFLPAVLAMGSLVLALAISKGKQAERPAVGMMGSVVHGLRYARNDEIIFGLMLLTLAASFFGRSYQNLLPVYARDILEVGPEGLGLLLMAPAAGTIIGAVGLASLPRVVGNQPRAIIATGIGSGVLLSLFAFSTSLAPAIVFLMLAGLVHSISMVVAGTLLQLRVTDEFRGRVLSLHMVVTQGLGAMGTMFMGSLAVLIETPGALAASGALAVAGVGLVALAFPALRNFRE